MFYLFCIYSNTLAAYHGNTNKCNEIKVYYPLYTPFCQSTKHIPKSEKLKYKVLRCYKPNFSSIVAAVYLSVETYWNHIYKINEIQCVTPNPSTLMIHDIGFHLLNRAKVCYAKLAIIESYLCINAHLSATAVWIYTRTHASYIYIEIYLYWWCLWIWIENTSGELIKVYIGNRCIIQALYIFLYVQESLPVFSIHVLLICYTK